MDSNIDDFPEDILEQDIPTTPRLHDSSSNTSSDDYQQENAIGNAGHTGYVVSQPAEDIVCRDYMVDLYGQPFAAEPATEVLNVAFEQDIPTTPRIHDSSSKTSSDEDDVDDYQQENAIGNASHTGCVVSQPAEDNICRYDMVELDGQPSVVEPTTDVPIVTYKPDPLVVFTDESSDDDEGNGTKRQSEALNIFANEFHTEGEHESDHNNVQEEPAIKSIFGVSDEDSSDDKSDAGSPVEQDEHVASRKDNNKDELDEGREWDFDIMMRQKKTARRKRRRRRDGGIDIINDDDYEISTLVEEMKVATREDRQSNQQRLPALRKRKLLPQVKLMLLRVESIDTLIDNGMMSAVSDWMSPLPDKSLPALEIRTDLLKLLQSYSRLEQGCLKQSGLGKAVMMLYKHPRETKENKDRAAKLIREWSRPIFQLDDDFRSLSREERVERDLKNMPAAKKQRLSGESKTRSTFENAGGIATNESMGRGTKRYVGRASIPRPSSTDYVHRPKYNVDGQFKGERKNNAFKQLDKIQRDFTERARMNKARRAVRVSVEGKNMGI